MTYRVVGDGGLFPEGYSAEVMTANGAVERVLGVRFLCERWVVLNEHEEPISLIELHARAEAELNEI